MYSRIIISINGMDIIVTLDVYFEYIKVLCKIFIQCIVSILQVYPSYFILLLKIITNDFLLYYILLYICMN
jgi:hypothetical protein